MSSSQSSVAFVFIVALGLFCGPSLLWAAPAPATPASDQSPKALIEHRHGEFHRLLTDGKNKPVEQVHDGIRGVLKTFVDFEAVSRRALKRYFDDLKPAQKKRFTEAFKGLVEATYLKRLKPGSDYEMLFQGEPELREGKARVRTLIKRGDSEVEVAYLLGKRDDGVWKAYDIVIDEVSMARNYRKEFYRLFKDKGFTGLVERIEERTQEKKSEL